jgi:4-diphosphocytidyl-2C-methyl-D-erythritol kinase
MKKMKTEKLSLSNMKNMLSRAEMKKIMAGSGTGAGCFAICNQDTSDGNNVSDCSSGTVEQLCGSDLSNAVCVCS